MFLDRLLGVAAIAGRRFFAGRGFLNRLTSLGPESEGWAVLLGAALETFEVFETWLSRRSAAA